MATHQMNPLPSNHGNKGYPSLSGKIAQQQHIFVDMPQNKAHTIKTKIRENSSPNLSLDFL